MRRSLLAASALLLAAPALALETPRACSAADPRVRCIAYDPAQVVQLFAATGAALTVEFADAETIVDASTSDNGLLEGGEASARQALAIAETGGGARHRRPQPDDGQARRLPLPQAAAPAAAATHHRPDPAGGRPDAPLHLPAGGPGRAT